MHRIDGAGHVDHQFVDEDVVLNREATVVTPAFLNAVQEELANICAAAGVDLIKADNAQVVKAIRVVCGQELQPHLAALAAAQITAMLRDLRQHDSLTTVAARIGLLERAANRLSDDIAADRQRLDALEATNLLQTSALLASLATNLINTQRHLLAPLTA